MQINKKDITKEMTFFPLLSSPLGAPTDYMYRKPISIPLHENGSLGSCGAYQKTS